MLLSQLSVRIYRTLTTGRRGASNDLREISNILFGLRCALDHLSDVADDLAMGINSSRSVDVDGEQARRRLDQMVRNCATTLEDLDAATLKYRDVVQQSDDVTLMDSASSETRRAKMKRSFASEITKIRWDIDKGNIKLYRDKLQAHTDAISGARYQKSPFIKTRQNMGSASSETPRNDY